MKRKVIKQGHNTLTITLPAKWIEKADIKPGDEIDISEDGQGLVISREGPKHFSEKFINIDKYDIMIPRTIHALYKKGVDQIRFSYSDSKLSSKIQKAIREETLGYEIIKQRSDFCIVKCITNQVQSEFSPLLRRTFLLLISMAEDSLTAVKDKDYESLKNIRFMELTNNRYVTICRRIINKIGLPDYQNPNFIYYIIEELERLADHYKYICDYFLGLENEINLSKKTHDFYKETNSMVRDLYNLFYNFKPETAVAVAKKRKRLVKASFELFEHAPRNELVVVHNLSIIFQKIFCSLGIIIAMNV